MISNIFIFVVSFALSNDLVIVFGLVHIIFCTILSQIPNDGVVSSVRGYSLNTALDSRSVKCLPLTSFSIVLFEVTAAHLLIKLFASSGTVAHMLLHFSNTNIVF